MADCELAFEGVDLLAAERRSVAIGRCLGNVSILSVSCFAIGKEDVSKTNTSSPRYCHNCCSTAAVTVNGRRARAVGVVAE
jgi:hypothetical protein